MWLRPKLGPGIFFKKLLKVLKNGVKGYSLATDEGRQLEGLASLKASWSAVHNSALFVTLRSLRVQSKYDHRFSIGFKSGLCDGHSSGSSPICLMYRRVALEVCFGSLSC